MAYRYFASRTIYQIVAAMETLFSVVILIFACKTVKEYHEEETTFQLNNQILLYSGIVGIVVSLVQILASVALLWSSRVVGPTPAFDKDDLAVSKVPTIWFFLSFLTFGLLIFVFLGPLLEEKVKRGLKDSLLKQSISHLFTYVVANALFKLLFLWAMSTTIRFRRSSRFPGAVLEVER